MILYKSQNVRKVIGLVLKYLNECNRELNSILKY